VAIHRFSPLPKVGAWRLVGAHEGFEVARFGVTAGGMTIAGTTLGIEADVPWSLTYSVELDASWHTRHAIIEDGDGRRLEIAVEGNHHWTIDGKHDAGLDGYFDLDLEGSAVTNTIPIHRLGLAEGDQADAPAVYVRANGLVVEPLEQTYRRLPDVDGSLLFDYVSPRFDYRGRLRFAQDGLILDYPEIAVRVPTQNNARK
jgi:uncharacterized protein